MINNTGIFKVDSSGEIKVNYLFDGGMVSWRTRRF